jgi:hypothetical protein
MEKRPDKNTSKGGVHLEHSVKQPVSNLKADPNNPPTKLSQATPKEGSNGTGQSTKS